MQILCNREKAGLVTPYMRAIVQANHEGPERDLVLADAVSCYGGVLVTAEKFGFTLGQDMSEARLMFFTAKGDLKWDMIVGKPTRQLVPTDKVKAYYGPGINGRHRHAIYDCYFYTEPYGDGSVHRGQDHFRAEESCGKWLTKDEFAELVARNPDKELRSADAEELGYFR